MSTSTKSPKKNPWRVTPEEVENHPVGYIPAFRLAVAEALRTALPDGTGARLARAMETYEPVREGPDKQAARGLAENSAVMEALRKTAARIRVVVPGEIEFEFGHNPKGSPTSRHMHRHNFSIQRFANRVRTLNSFVEAMAALPKDGSGLNEEVTQRYRYFSRDISRRGTVDHEEILRQACRQFLKPAGPDDGPAL